jgi:hypothetical protein
MLLLFGWLPAVGVTICSIRDQEPGSLPATRTRRGYFDSAGDGTKTISRVTAPIESGEPATGISAPVFESSANPAACCSTVLTNTNLPARSTAMDDGWADIHASIAPSLRKIAEVFRTVDS